MDPGQSGRGRPLTPAMQHEMDKIVFKGHAPASAEPYAGSDAYMVKPLPVNPSPLKGPRLFAGKHEKDHFLHQSEMVLGDAADDDLAHGPVHVDGRAAADHFGEGMVMSTANDTSMAFDRVYDTRHEGMDTADHFALGMQMAGDAETLALEAKRAARKQAFDKAKAALDAEVDSPDQKHMGHEQQYGEGDTKDHFGLGMQMADDVDTSMPFDRIYDSRFDGRDVEDHFDHGTLNLVAEADEGNTFDRVFGSAHDGRNAEDHFRPGTLVPSIGPPGLREVSDMRHYPTLTKAELYPPPRPKFLHGTPPGQSPKTAKPLSPAMQAQVDAIVVKQPAGGSQPKRAAGESATIIAGLTPYAARTKTASEGSTAGGGGGGGGGGDRFGEPSRQSFAWDSERIAHELVCKFDQFTRRREDHMRKLLWTFGSDPSFESGGSNKNAIHVSPNNFHRVCDRFGLVCDQQQAHEIFASHNLPAEGCNMYTLAKNFLDTEEGLTRQRGGGHRSLAAMRNIEPGPPLKDPFKHAKLPDNAWRDHRATGAAAAPFAVTLPPIISAKP